MSKLMCVCFREKKAEGEETERAEKTEKRSQRGREREGERGGEKAGEGGQREGKQSHTKERPAEAKERSKERREKEGKERRREAVEHEPMERPQHKVHVCMYYAVIIRKLKGVICLLQPSRSRPDPVVREGRRAEESAEDEGLGSETRLDRPRSAKGHRRRVEMVEREGEGEVQSKDHLQETHPSQQSPSPPPPITHPPPPPMGLV